MSKEIDWSKAPEGAMVLLKHVIDGAYAVSESYSDEAKTWHWPDLRYSFNIIPSMWRIVAYRPTTPSWSGEGLPPVGCKIENRSDYKGWSVVIMHRHGAALVEQEDGVAADYVLIGKSLCFPARTPEQIAADERDKAAHELFRSAWPETHSWGDLSPHWQEAFYRLADAGFRKT